MGEAKGPARLAISLIAAQLILTLAIAIYFAAVARQQDRSRATAAAEAVQASQAVIREIRSDLTIHAEASATRSCAVANILDYLTEHSPLQRTEHQVEHVSMLVDQSCRFVPPIPRGP